MQNYGYQQPGYQRPESTTGSAAPAVPPPYGTPQGYQTAGPQISSQWAPPAQSQTPAQQQWNQTQPGAGYNPGTYGAMPGGYSQAQQTPAHSTTAYHTQQQDVPPPPPPKPAAFTATYQQNNQQWGHQSGYNAQDSNGYVNQGSQSGYAQQSGYPTQATTQQTYNQVAPPPPSQTPGGSYFPPTQTPQAGGRPNSIYGAGQAGIYSTPSSTVAQHPPASVLSPNEQQPAYVPPSLSGQGVQSYIPTNANPAPGVYAPPPPNLPAWQQASHAPLQGDNKFKYTKPADPNFYAQSQGQHTQQPGQYSQPYGQTVAQAQQSAQQGHPVASQGFQGSSQQPVHYEQSSQTHQPQYGQPTEQMNMAQTNSSYQQPPPDQQGQHHNQWQPNPTAPYGFSQQQTTGSQAPPTEHQQSEHQQSEHQQSEHQQTWHSDHQAQGSIQAPKPTSGHTGITHPGFAVDVSPKSHPVSPIQGRYNETAGYGHTGPGREGSVSSIALSAINAQRLDNRTASPTPLQSELPATSAAPSGPSKFSALGAGGPSDWEYFGGGEEVDDEEEAGAKTEAATKAPSQLASAELPAHQVSPPQTQGEWPTPPVRPASTSFPNRDSYQPTPPPTNAAPIQPPPSQVVYQGLAMHGPTTHSSQLNDGFTANNVVVAPLNVSKKTSSQRTTPAQKHPQYQPPPMTGSSAVIDDTAPAASQHDASRSNNQWTTQTNNDHAAELQMKDEAFGRLQAETEKEKTNLRSEIEQLQIVIKTIQSNAEGEREKLTKEIEAMKVTADQTMNSTEALSKEKDATIERLNQEAGEKEDTIREKESEISQLKAEVQTKEETINKGHAFVDDLKQQLESRDGEIDRLKQQVVDITGKDDEINDLKKQLEAENSREIPKATPADLVSDIDPWYASSLDRYITMLRSEAHEPLVENKIQIFTGFLKSESGFRGLDYYSTPPQPPAGQNLTQQPSAVVTSTTEALNVLKKQEDLNIQVPAESSGGDDMQYSPGGRPIVQHRPITRPNDSATPRKPFSVSSQSTTILTPTSSQGDVLDNSTPVQSPPEPQAQSQYKAYVPSVAADSASVHRQSVSSTTPPVLNPGFPKPINNKDVLFFGGNATQSSSKPSSRPTTSAGTTPDIAIPAPLFTPQPPSLSIRTAPKEDAVARLTKLLPSKVSLPQPNRELEALRKRISDYPLNKSALQDLTAPWEKDASSIRKKNDNARRKRQEDSEEQTDQLFNDHEISYADIAEIEEDFKEQERKSKADEDRDEYQSYVETVFDKVYDALQLHIKGLMDLHVETERLMSTVVSGVKTLEGTDAVTTEACLKLMEDLNEEMEQRHEKVFEAVAERDKRYKKTEVQPLYAAGNIAKMKAVEKQFLNAEKEAAQRARSEKVDRLTEFVHIAEEAVVAAVELEQQDIQAILAAVRDLPPAFDEDILRRARETVLALGESSKSLLTLLNGIEIGFGGSMLEAQLTDAKAEKQSDKISEVQKELNDREKQLKGELERKISVLEQDKETIDKLIKENKEKTSAPSEAAKPEMTEEELRKARLSKALEEAKRRNGDL